MTSGREFVVKIVTIFAFCGGPLLCTDVLKPALGQKGAIAVTVTPLVAMLLATVVFFDEAPSRIVRALAAIGLAGAAALLGMNVYASWRIFGGWDSRDMGLILLGLLVGGVAIVAYVGLALRALRGEDLRPE